ncbi:MAG: 3-keto-5-aminohexanoate cleavage protein, partial [Candidatus Puniceispirillaceae bacterium]
QAKFGLEAPFCQSLKQHHILYDEDEYGQFLHLYCHLQDTGLFFEFVQRKAGYTGFGAANAPYRLSAQRRIGQ